MLQIDNTMHRWITIPIFSILLLPSISAIAEDQAAQCFNVHPSHAISNASPLAELFKVSAGDCLNYCIVKASRVGEKCASVVYHNKYVTCQLYAHSGDLNGSAIVPVHGHDLYIRSSWEGLCRDKFVPRLGFSANAKIFGSSGVQRIVPINLPSSSRTTTLPPNKSMRNYRNFGHLDVRNFANNNVPLQQSSASFIPPLSSNKITGDVRDAKEIDSFAQPQPYNPQLDDNYQRQTALNSRISQNRKEPLSRDPTVAFVNPTHSSKCENREKIGYFVLFSYKLVSKLQPQYVKGIDQSSCIMYCSQNINAIGDPTPCHSANYEPNEEICTIYGEQNRQMNQAARLKKDERLIFVDKFCMETRKDCSHETPYIVYMHKQIEKAVIRSVPGMNSIVACLAECVDEKECRAVTYKLGFCILHSASPSLENSLLKEGSEHTLVVENGCQLTASNVPSLLSHTIEDEVLWAEWSACQFGTKQKRLRVRHKLNQNSNDQDVQIEEC